MVEQIAEYLRSTGVAEHISAVTQRLEEDDSNQENFDSDGTSDKALYRITLQIIQIKRKVSISHAQRCLRIGYDKADITVEKMEHRGVISPPNHVGKREILLTEN